MRNIISLPTKLILIVALMFSSIAWRIEYLDGQRLLLHKLLWNDFEERVFFDTDVNESVRFHYFYYDIEDYIA